MGSRVKTNGILGRYSRHTVADESTASTSVRVTHKRTFNLDRSVNGYHDTTPCDKDTLPDDEKLIRSIDVVSGKLDETLRLMDAWEYRMYGSSSKDAVCLQMSLGGPLITTKQSSSFEDEIEFRLERMTAIARTLRNICAKEKEEKLQLFRFTNGNFHNMKHDMSLLKKTLSRKYEEQDKVIKTLEKQLITMEEEKHSTKDAFEKLLANTSDSMQGLESKLGQAELKVQETRNELEELIEENRKLTEENNSMKCQAGDLDLIVSTMKEKCAKEEAGREQLETLLEIAIAKVKVHEESPSPTDQGIKVKTNSSDEITNLGYQASTPLYGRHVSFDSLSVSSYDSDVLPQPTATVSMNNLSDITTGNASGGSIKSLPFASPSPSSIRKKRHRPKLFFKQLLKRSMSVGTPIRRAKSSEPLETITDETVENSRDVDISTEHSDHNTEIHKDGTEYQNGHREKEIQYHRSVSDDTKVTTDMKETGDQEQGDGSGNSLRECQIQRNLSFNNSRISKKGILVSFAKDLEKKIKRKRRSKTVDPVDFAKAKEEFKETSDF